MKRSLKRKTAFTLIELVVVIAILAVLAIIAMPRLLDLPAKANKKTILANLKTLNETADAFAAAHGIPVTEIDAIESLSPYFFTPLPAGPGSTIYTMTDGIATAVVPSGIMGIPAGDYQYGDSMLLE